MCVKIGILLHLLKRVVPLNLEIEFTFLCRLSNNIGCVLVQTIETSFHLIAAYVVGETFYVSSTKLNWSEVIDKWAEEKAHFSYAGINNVSLVSNYTQVFVVFYITLYYTLLLLIETNNVMKITAALLCVIVYFKMCFKTMKCFSLS